MSRMHSECLDSDPADGSVGVDVILRQDQTSKKTKRKMTTTAKMTMMTTGTKATRSERALIQWVKDEA